MKNTKTKIIPTMVESRLIQRLKTPFDKNKKTSFKNPFHAFGGGLKNGGLSDEAMNILSTIFEFDYMGAAEFELGIVPKIISFIADNCDQFCSYEEDIEYKYNNSLTWFVSRKEDFITGTNKVYIICPENWKDEVLKRIKKWAKHNERDIKEATFFSSSLSKNLKKERIGGWLELNNGFMFFTDKNMFDGMKKILEIK